MQSIYFLAEKTVNNEYTVSLLPYRDFDHAKACAQDFMHTNSRLYKVVERQRKRKNSKKFVDVWHSV